MAEQDPWPLFDLEREASSGEGTRRFARRGVRVHFASAGGSGSADMISLDDDTQLNIADFVLPHLMRRPYRSDEPVVMLRASLSCDVAFRFDGSPPMVFDRPELTLACVPGGRRFTIDVAGGSRQQGMIVTFLARSFAARHGLLDADLPPIVRDALAERDAIGRIATFPLEHRVATLVADAIDSPLDGELKVVQMAGRLSELVAYTLEALRRSAAPKDSALARRSDVEVARAALARLSRDYRRPPPLAELAHELGTNQNRLKAVFKLAFGRTIAEHCLERRMREAQQLLIEGRLSLARVAEQVGYEHHSSFTTAFRTHLGVSPRDYRKQRAPFSVSIGGPGGNSA